MKIIIENKNVIYNAKLTTLLKPVHPSTYNEHFQFSAKVHVNCPSAYEQPDVCIEYSV